MAAILSKLQKRILSQLAARAFKRECEKARGRGENPDSSWRAHDGWRRQQVAKACRKVGLRCCSQDDYKLVEAHFLHLIGEDGAALNSYVDDSKNPRRVWWHKLMEELRRGEQVGIGLDYLATICRATCKCDLTQTSEVQVRNLFFTLRNRINARIQ